MNTPELEKIIVAFYKFFDNQDGKPIKVSEIFNSVLPTMRVFYRDADQIHCWSLEEFLGPRLKMLSDGTLTDFCEWETRFSTVIRGGIATRQSEYEKRGYREGVLFTGKGHKLIHLCLTPNGWRIVSLLWEDVGGRFGSAS